jgi:hypothetical protein
VLREHLKYPVLAPDDGGAPAGGTAGGETTPPPNDNAPDKKVVDQDSLNAAIKSIKKEAEAKIKKAEERASAVEGKLNELLAKLDKQNEPDDKTEAGRLEAQQRKHQREVEELNKKLSELDSRATQAETRRLETLRDRALDEALVAAGCVDLKAGRRYFLPDITKQDPEDGTDLEDWSLKSPTGKLVDIPTGVMEHLPKYLRNPAANVGGAGTTGGGPKAKDKDKIKALEAEVENLRKQAEAAGNRNSPVIQQWWAKKRELREAKQAAGVK